MFVALVFSALASFGAEDTRTLLALTPSLNGSIAEEEWLSLKAEGNAMSFLQWEPGVLYFAGSADSGDDLVFSFDTGGDGWLVGNDNLEVRVKYKNGQGSFTARTLDASDREGPKWSSTELEGLGMVFGTHGDRWLVEVIARGELGELTSAGALFGAGAESLATGASTGPAHLPRALTFYKFGFDLAEGLPEGGAFSSGTMLRTVARQDKLSMEFSVKGGGTYATGETRGEGLARSGVAVVTRAFSESNGKTKFKYESAVDAETPTGWRVLRTTLVDSNGGKALLRTSFKVSELVEFDVSLPESIEYSDQARTVSGQVIVQSMGTGRIQGEFHSSAPLGWTVEKGASQKLLIYNPRGREKINLKLQLPAGAAGTGDVTFTVVVGDRIYTKTAQIKIAEPK